MAGSSQSTNLFGSVKELRSIFNKLDTNRDGKISCADLMNSLEELGTEISSDDAERIMQEIDKDGDGQIDFDEFVAFVQNGGRDGVGASRSWEEELKDAFDHYDADRNGLITAAELHEVMKMLGLNSSLSDCAEMIRQVDEDGDGGVNFNEFKKMMTRESK